MVKFTSKNLAKNVNVSNEHPLKEFLILSVSLIAIVVLMYVSLGMALDYLIKNSSDRLEGYLSKAISTQKWMKSWDRSESQIKVQAILDKLVENADLHSYDFNVRVIKDEQVNALALPGGHIILFQGLLDVIESENELAMVLAHELGHYEHKDHLRGFGRGIVLAFISASVFGQNAAISDMLFGALGSVDLRFSRKQELAADQFGIQLLNQTYGHVGGAKEMFRKLSEANELPKLVSYLSTHPHGTQRVREIEVEILQQGYMINELIPLSFSEMGYLSANPQE